MTVSYFIELFAYDAYLRDITSSDLDAEVSYKNSQGAAFQTPVRDILMQVIIHGGYHRGQIAAALRAGGGNPINTDFITYLRAQKGS